MHTSHNKFLLQVGNIAQPKLQRSPKKINGNYEGILHTLSRELTIKSAQSLSWKCLPI